MLLSMKQYFPTLCLNGVTGMSTKETDIRLDKDQIIEILDRFDIEYWTSGKNVTIDNVNIQCPFCDDRSNHMGISPEGAYHCWKCTSTGFFPYLLSRAAGIQYEYAVQLVSTPHQFSKNATETLKDLWNPEQKQEIEPDIKLEFPKYCELISHDTRSKLLDRYLHRRQYTREDVIEKGCYICEHGAYANRIIIPVHFRGKAVSWQAADMTGRATIKYRTAAHIKINQFLYGYDNIRDRMIVVEGILDAWRLWNDVVCSFGTSITERQIQLIRQADLKELIFCWDSDAYWKARQVAEEFKQTIEIVRVVKLPRGEDPDSYGYTETMELIERSLTE